MVASPCINVCQMDELTGLCSGWAGVDDSRRRGILAAIAKRRQEHDPWEGDLRGDCDQHG